MRKVSLFISILICTSLTVSGASCFWPFKKKKVVEVHKKEDINKKYKDLITSKAKTTKGFMIVHKLDSKYYFEIPDSILGRDLLVVNRISKSAADNHRGFIGYAGDQIGEDVIRFEKGPNDKIFVKSISFAERSKDSLGMYFSVRNSNLQPIMASFDVKAYNRDTVSKKSKAVIDVTDLLNSDSPLLFFNDYIKMSLGLGNYLGDRSYVDTIKTYPMNLEIKAVKTYLQKSQFASGTAYTYLLNSSIVLLPKEPMKPRYFDERVAYFATGYTDYDKNPQGVEDVSMITRFRLEPKPEDVQKYKNGELVEPQKPIVFYIDPTTPKKWVPYLIQGVNDWQKAFEKAGFKNAIYALEAPKDSTWSLEDARHNAIVYKPSDVENASGPHVHDPRSGEVIETHVNWYHNIMKLLHDWYFVQASPVDKKAQGMQFDDELMGELIRFVSSHEVGHTLGLRHNFGSSATIPVEKLRDKKWVEANGHTPSIMDYARFNYVAQPEDSISALGLFPRIGIYDEWSIEWGYKWLPQFSTPQDEVPYLNKWVIEKLASDKRYTFGTESDPDDPRNQSEAIGDNAMQASTYGIKNLQRIIPNLLKWTKEPDKDYASTREIYQQVFGQFSRYMGHVTKYVGGIYNTPRKVEQKDPVIEYVPAQLQKDAIDFLGKQLFTTPMWLADKELMEKAEIDPINNISSLQSGVLHRLINAYTFGKMLKNEAYNGTAAYTPFQMLDALKKNIWSELSSGKQIDIYRRNLQKSYVDALIQLNSQDGTDAAGIARITLEGLKTDIVRAMNSSTSIKKAHLSDLNAQIEKALNTKK